MVATVVVVVVVVDDWAMKLGSRVSSIVRSL